MVKRCIALYTYTYVYPVRACERGIAKGIMECNENGVTVVFTVMGGTYKRVWVVSGAHA